MLLATEAREQTKHIIQTHATEEIEQLEKWIAQHIKNGDYEFSFNGYISPTAKEELERCGYTVTVGSQYNQGYVNISWKLEGYLKEDNYDR